MAIKQILLKLLDDDVDMVKWLNRQDNRSETIRLAIRLLMELDAGSTDFLFDLFPDLKQDFAKETPPPEPPASGGGNDEMLEVLKDIATGVREMAKKGVMHAPPTTYQMVEQPLPVKMTPPTAPAFAGTKTNGKTGDSAMNLLASLDNFGRE